MAIRFRGSDIQIIALFGVDNDLSLVILSDTETKKIISAGERAVSIFLLLRMSYAAINLHAGGPKNREPWREFFLELTGPFATSINDCAKYKSICIS